MVARPTDAQFTDYQSFEANSPKPMAVVPADGSDRSDHAAGRMTSLRDGWEHAWVDNAQLRKIDPNDAAAKAAYMATFDTQAAADGYKVEPAQPAAPKAADYKPDFGKLGQEMPIQKLATLHKESTEWAAQIGFAPELGSAVVERVAQLGPVLAKLGEDERRRHREEEHKELVRQAKSEEAAEQIIADAKKALARAETKPFGATAKLIGENGDWWLAVTLANHHRATT